MSWSANTGSTPVERIEILSMTGQPQTSPEGVTEAYEHHLAGARDAAMQLAYVMGRPEDLVSVSMSGHANPDHAPMAGWGDEFITITVSVKPKAPQPASDA